MNNWRAETLNLERSGPTSLRRRSLGTLLVLCFWIGAYGSAEAYDTELYWEQASSMASELSGLASDDSSPNPKTSRIAHDGLITEIIFSPDGSLIATASKDGNVRIWDAADESPIRTLTGHRGGVNSIAFSPDGALLASGSDDRTAETLECYRWIPGANTVSAHGEQSRRGGVFSGRLSGRVGRKPVCCGASKSTHGDSEPDDRPTWLRAWKSWRFGRFLGSGIRQRWKSRAYRRRAAVLWRRHPPMDTDRRVHTSRRVEDRQRRGPRYGSLARWLGDRACFSRAFRFLAVGCGNR